MKDEIFKRKQILYGGKVAAMNGLFYYGFIYLIHLW